MLFELLGLNWPNIQVLGKLVFRQTNKLTTWAIVGHLMTSLLPSISAPYSVLVRNCVEVGETPWERCYASWPSTRTYNTAWTLKCSFGEETFGLACPSALVCPFLPCWFKPGVVAHPSSPSIWIRRQEGGEFKVIRTHKPRPCSKKKEETLSKSVRWRDGL